MVYYWLSLRQASNESMLAVSACLICAIYLFKLERLQ